MSATAMESEQLDGFLYGMHFFCPKPANLEILSLILNAKRQTTNNDAAVSLICEQTGTTGNNNNDNNYYYIIVHRD